MKEQGTVKFFNVAKGFGFITSNKGKDYFIHSSGLNGVTLTEGAKVEFETRQGQKGWRLLTCLYLVNNCPQKIKNFATMLLYKHTRSIVVFILW